MNIKYYLYIIVCVYACVCVCVGIALIKHTIFKLIHTQTEGQGGEEKEEEQPGELTILANGSQL